MSERHDNPAKWQGLIMRCAICGNAAPEGLAIRHDYFLCSKCSRQNSSSLMGTESIIVCPCGYRFLDGWASWYYGAKDTAKCPNCGSRIANSGAINRMPSERSGSESIHPYRLQHERGTRSYWVLGALWRRCWCRWRQLYLDYLPLRLSGNGHRYGDTRCHRFWGDCIWLAAFNR